MSRGGARWGAGRPGWHAKAEECLRLDVRTMQRQGCLALGRAGGWAWTDRETGERVASIGYAVEATGPIGLLVLRYHVNGEAREDRITLSSTRGPIGGDRPWFLCPVRGERVAILYQRHGRFACRRCNRVAYVSQSEDWLGRVWRRQRKLEGRLVDGCARPIGMHGKTFRGLLAAIDECEAAKDSALLEMMARRGWLD